MTFADNGSAVAIVTINFTVHFHRQLGDLKYASTIIFAYKMKRMASFVISIVDIEWLTIHSLGMDHHRQNQVSPNPIIYSDTYFNSSMCPYDY